MTEINHILIKEEELKELSEAYFAGNLPPQGIEKLRHAASLVASGSMAVADQELAGDLAMIDALEAYALSSLHSIAEKMPVNLEKQLDVHITALAAARRRKWIWIKTGCAAACVALLISVTLKVFLPTGQKDAILSGNTANPVASPAATAQTVPFLAEAPHLEPPAVETITQVKSGVVTSVRVKPPHATEEVNQNKVRLTYPDDFSQIQYPGLITSIILPDSISIPASISRLPAATPPLPAATTEVAEMIASPFEKLSQSFENIIESLNFVNGVIYEAHQTASSLSEDFIIASAAPLK